MDPYKISLNMTCRSTKVICIKENLKNKYENFILRIDHAPHRCVNVIQDHGPALDNLWKVHFNKTCCDIQNKSGYEKE
jgi:hypothetical protein